MQLNEFLQSAADLCQKRDIIIQIDYILFAKAGETEFGAGRMLGTGAELII